MTCLKQRDLCNQAQRPGKGRIQYQCLGALYLYVSRRYSDLALAYLVETLDESCPGQLLKDADLKSAFVLWYCR